MGGVGAGEEAGKGAGEGSWRSEWVSGNARAHALRRLACGARYRVRMSALGPAGTSPPSAELIAGTSGGREYLSSNNVNVYHILEMYGLYFFTSTSKSN